MKCVMWYIHSCHFLSCFLSLFSICLRQFLSIFQFNLLLIDFTTHLLFNKKKTTYFLSFHSPFIVLQTIDVVIVFSEWVIKEDSFVCLVLKKQQQVAFVNFPLFARFSLERFLHLYSLAQISRCSSHIS